MKEGQGAAAGAPAVGGPGAPSGSSADEANQLTDAATTTTSVEEETHSGSPEQGGAEGSSADDGQQDEEGDEEQGTAESQPGTEAHQVIHGTTAGVEPAPTNEAGASSVSSAANDNDPPAELPATGTE